jgi:hypothetical protein
MVLYVGFGAAGIALAAALGLLLAAIYGTLLTA